MFRRNILSVIDHTNFSAFSLDVVMISLKCLTFCIGVGRNEVVEIPIKMLQALIFMLRFVINLLSVFNRPYTPMIYSGTSPFTHFSLNLRR